MENKKTEREADLILSSYIYIYETICTIKDCPLKRYIKLSESGTEANGCLLQHANLLFSYSLVKYPESIEIKFAYALFVFIKKIKKKKKKASEFLNGIKN